jgi:hypothetical protein
MIPNQAKQAVELSRLASNEMEQKEFMSRRHNRLMYYNAETEDLTRDWFSKNLLKNVPIGNINITKRVIDRTSEVYMVEALRFFEEDKPTERYNEMIPKKHERMQRIEKMTNLLDVVAIHPFWNEHKGIIDHAIILEFQPFFDLHGDLVGIRYPLRQSSNASSIDEQTFVEWDLNGYRIVDMNGIGSGYTEYPYKYPFSLAWTDEPEYFYDHNPTADLSQGNLCINFYQTALNANVGFQSFGQPYVTGLQADQKIEWGIDKVPALPEGSSAGILSPPSTVSDVVEAQTNLYKLIARNYHLPEDFVEGSAQAESGVAIKLRNQELQNERIGDVARWRNVEDEVYAIERDILSRVNVQLPESIMVDFSESIEYLSPQEQREQDDWDLEHNMINLADIAMRKNKDLDEEQAQKDILENAERNSAVKKVSNGRNSIVDDILGADNGGLL